MKKLIVLILATVAMSSQAAQIVSIVWPFNIVSTQANYARALVTEANKTQNKFTFVLENKTGAGSSIAANYVANSRELSIMAATSSFFIRPNFFPNSSHTIDQFNPLMIQCAVPMIAVSSKYKTLKDIDPTTRLTIGVSGLGTTTHLLTAEMKKKHTGLTAVPYTGTMEPIKDMLGGTLDMAVGFPGELKQFIDNKQLNVIGISGPKTASGHPSLQSVGFAGTEFVVNTHFLAIPKTIPADTVNQLRGILNQASKTKLVRDAYAVDDCIDGNVDEVKTARWFDEQIRYWQRVTYGIKLD